MKVAQAQGWLDASAELPGDEAVAEAMKPRKRVASTVSSAEPCSRSCSAGSTLACRAARSTPRSSAPERLIIDNVGDEVVRRENKKFSMRLRRAQFRTTKTLEQFDFERLPKSNRALVHDLATGRYLHEKERKAR